VAPPIMSKRFSLVLSEIGQTSSVQRPRSYGAFSPVVVPAVAAAVVDLCNGAGMTRRGPPAYSADAESGAAQNGICIASPSLHQHHVVALDVPSLPKRAGLRNCLVCVACLWLWIASTIFFAVVSWRPEFAVAIQVSRRIAFPQQPVLPPRVASEHNQCTFSVLATVGKPSRLQVLVSLASVLAPSVEEDDIALQQLSPGFFEVTVACCTPDLHQTLRSSRVMELWNGALASHYEASVIVSRPVEIEVPPRAVNESLV
jgi:hypothetical protein